MYLKVVIVEMVHGTCIPMYNDSAGKKIIGAGSQPYEFFNYIATVGIG
jgi:hypothetical protein